jgi:hypothetical protein
MTDLATNTTAVTTMITSLATVFTVFPINIMIVLALGGGAFVLLKKGKKVATRH